MDKEGTALSHADLFGPYAVAFDPVHARRLGIVPTIYYSPSDLLGDRYDSLGESAAGLNIQMIQRLKEIREVLIVLANIEPQPRIGNTSFSESTMFDSLNLTLPFNQDIQRSLSSLSQTQREWILGFFNTDREIALVLVSCVDMMLSLFQETDSTLDGTVLAFYEQREWRLIHHMRAGMLWYCLGEQPHFRDPFAVSRQFQIRALRKILETAAGRHRDEGYFRHCWVLEEVDGVHIRDYITSIIVPHAVLSQTCALARNAGCNAQVVASEEFGYSR